MLSMPPGLVPGYLYVSPLEAVLRMGLYKYFLDLITTELIEELGMPPYLPSIMAWLLTSFLSLPEEEEQETMVEIIELDEPLEPIGFRRSVSESEARPISPAAPIVPSILIQHISLLHPAPTFINEPRLAQTLLNELRLAPTVELNEQNIFTPTESTPSGLTKSIPAFACAVPTEPPIQLEIVPPAVLLASAVPHPCTDLIVDNHLPFYNANGYMVSQTMLISAHVQNIVAILLHYYLGRNARLSPITETGGILLHLPIDAIIFPGDMLMLWTVFEMVANIPLVTSFVPHDCARFRLRVVISIAYMDGHLHLLSEPDSINGTLVHETLAIQLASADPYRYHVQGMP